MAYQVGASLMDTLVLSLISERDTYGYMISQEIKPIVDLKEATLYPALKRLQQADLVTTYNQPVQGRNRKYYHITETGVIQNKADLEEWKVYRDSIEDILYRKESSLTAVKDETDISLKSNGEDIQE